MVFIVSKPSEPACTRPGPQVAFLITPVFTLQCNAEIAAMIKAYRIREGATLNL